MSTWRDPDQTRRIAGRLIITGDLVLESPAHLGSGETEGSTDMPLLRDALEDRPLLTGSSIAGALRAYLLARERGYGIREGKKSSANAPDSLVEQLFGGAKGDPEGNQSPLIIDDALGAPVVSEIRDGVRIDSQWRTALDKLKYDAELLPPGLQFRLRFELLLSADRQAEQLGLLATALGAFEDGAIAIGARRSRGYGRCRVAGWRAAHFNLRDRAQLVAWLTLDEAAYPALTTTPPRPIAELPLLVGPEPIPDDQRHEITVAASFTLASPILIRAEQALTDEGNQPDVIHLRDGQGRPVIAGTSLAGALRSRALRILQTLGLSQEAPDSLLNRLFGKDMLRHSENPTASRLLVAEATISDGRPLIQQRVAIDRFTGGAADTALFREAPQVGGAVDLRLTIRKPAPAEIGLLLLLLKDLWTGDLHLGGTGSIGRGRLRGSAAVITLRNRGGGLQQWTIAEQEGTLTRTGDWSILEDHVRSLHGGGHG